MKKLNILVTGGNGFIGTNLIKKLEDKHKIRSFDLSNGDDIFSSKFEDNVKKNDVVIHLAAITSVQKSFKNPLETYMVNVLGTTHIAYLCAKYKKKLIYPSSAAVEHPELSPYANSKYLSEEVLKSLMEYTPIVILRFFNVFGPNMNKNSGSIMYNFMTAKKITIFGDGEQTRDYIHVRDVVSVIEDSLKRTYNGKIVEVGTGESLSTNYIAGLFSSYRGVPITFDLPRKEIKWSRANTEMLKSLYKKKLTTNVQKDIKELLNG